MGAWTPLSSPNSGIATGSQGGPLDSEKFAKNWEKEGETHEKDGKNQEKEGKSGKGKNWEGSFTLPLLRDRAGYVTVSKSF